MTSAAQVSVSTHRVLAEDGAALHVQVEDLPAPTPSRDWWQRLRTPSRKRQQPALTVVFCHGYGLSRHSWRYQRQAMRHLPGVRRLVYYDHRGHGRSESGPLEHCTLDQLGSDLAQVITQVVGPEGQASTDNPVVLVGHSMGGMAIMALAQQRPDWFGTRVQAVALLATSAGGLAHVDPLGVPPLVGALMRRSLPPVVALMGRAPALAQWGLPNSGRAPLRSTRKMRAEWDLALTRRSNFATDVPLPMLAWTSQMINHTPVPVWCAFFPTFHAHDKRDALPAIGQVPTLLLGAAQDVVTPMAHTLDMAAALPGARLVQIENAGHMVMAEHPDQVNHHLRELLARVAAGSKR